jgi:outer membrane receptor protein involved in Fe transport
MATLLCAPGQLAAQSPLEGIAGISVEGAGVEQALRLLRQVAGVSLVYSPDLLPQNRAVDCPCERLTVGQALGHILEGTGLTFRASGRQIRIVPADSPEPRALTGVISGQVTGSERGIPVVNAMIQLENGPGVISDETGSFTLRNVRPGTYRVAVTSIGWAPQILEVEVVAGDTLRLSFVLDAKAIPLPQILVMPGTFSILEDVTPGAVQALTREEIQTMPQVGEDVFRSMKRLPGVAAHDISTKLHVRGGTDDEVLVRLDGIELYEPYHMKDWDGALGIVDLNALGGVKLAAGGFGVEYGDKLTGVFDMRSRTTVGDDKTTLGMSISNLTAMNRGGFDGDKGSWLVSARQGFMGIVIRLIGEDERLSPQYSDVFAKVSYQPDRKNLVSAHVLHAGDDFGLHELDEVERVDLDTGWKSSYAWLNWESSLSDRLSSTTVAWTGRLKRSRHGLVEDLGRPGMPERISVVDDRTFTFAGIRQELGIELTERALLKVGTEARRLRMDYDYSGTTWTPILDDERIPVLRVDSSGVDLEREGNQIAAYAAARIRPVEGLTMEVGVRYDRVTHTDDSDVAPRLAAALDLDSATTIRGSWGRYYQSHGIHELEVGDGEIEYYPSERSEQIALGVERRFPGGINARVEFYDRAISDQRPRFLNLEQELEIFPEAEGDRLRIDAGRGRARGMELLVERKSGRRWAWSASYVLSLAEDELPDLYGADCSGGQGCANRLWVPRRFDQRHAVGLHASYSPDPRWAISWGWRYHSGWPVTEWSYDAERLQSGRTFWTRTFGPVRESRLPSYHRLDMRVTRDFTVRGNALHAFVDLFNLYDRTNLAGYYYGGTFENGRVTIERRDGQTLLPLLPTIGFRYEF